MRQLIQPPLIPVSDHLSALTALTLALRMKTLLTLWCIHQRGAGQYPLLPGFRKAKGLTQKLGPERSGVT